MGFLVAFLLGLVGSDGAWGRVFHVGPNSRYHTATEVVQAELQGVTFSENVIIAVEVPAEGYTNPELVDVADLGPMNGYTLEIIGVLPVDVGGTVVEATAYVDGHTVYKKDGEQMVLDHETINSAYGIEGRIESGGAAYFYGIDHLGSTRVVFTSTSEQSEALLYDLYGAMLKLQAAAGRTVLQKFTGQELDEDGLNTLNFTHRTYDPELGIWGSPDPLQESQNSYGYLASNPLNYVDFMGLGCVTYSVNGVTEMSCDSRPVSGANFPGFIGDPQSYLKQYAELLSFQKNLTSNASSDITRVSRGGKDYQGELWRELSDQVYHNVLANMDEGGNRALGKSLLIVYAFMPKSNLEAAVTGVTLGVGFWLSRGAAPVLFEQGMPMTRVVQQEEVFFRVMPRAHADDLAATGKVPATSETFISPSQAYSEAFDGALVELRVQSGTLQQLEQIGVRNTAALTEAAHPTMPLVNPGWTATNAFFKAEGSVINIGLGRGAALDIFNNNIVGFYVLRP